MTQLVYRFLLLCVSAVLLLGTAHVQAQGAPAPSAAAPGLPAAEVQTVENPYGVEALWAQGDFVARATLVILLLMSAATWYVGVMKFVQQRRLLNEARALKSGEAAISTRMQTLPQTSPYRDILHSGLSAGEQLRRSSSGRLDIDSWVANAVADAGDRIAHHLQNGMTVLATVGATAPFVGLFGTVWGIYHALTAIGVAGQASIDKVAGPVGEALIMTAIGLAVAVPAVLGYNWLLRRNKQVVEHARFYGGQLHAEVVLGVAG
ncbi:MotA/TolQ/ExbB proton channel family protein [Pseudorhodoferax sp.]|uniref:MotA/TolQ/ExbB proton channel family protein n=1 Tax=Pseudorhodoferax sp. TaxID=1993553 RepID=UPI002DD64921|nr:MotA/TolQ/ExbB proton channel family protein [Pseudorhodoferax sp.]